MASNDQSGATPVEPEGGPGGVDAAVNRLAHWLLGSTVTEPGWERMVADFKPSRRTPGAYLARIVEIRDGREVPGSSGILGPQTRAAPLLDDLREASYTPEEGAWLSATMILRAHGWPEPEYEVGVDMNHHEQPEVWAEEAPLDAEDLHADLARFPRRGRLPEWMRELLSDPGAEPAPDAGRSPQSDPSASSAPASETPSDAGQDPAATPAPPAPGSAAPEVPADDAEASPGEETVNEEVLRALDHYGRLPGEKTTVNVLRALMGGEMLLEVSGPGGAETPAGERGTYLQTVRASDGATLLAVYASAATARTMFEASGLPGPMRLERRRGVRILEGFLADQSCQDVVVEPNGEVSCRIERQLVEWALRTPRNDAAKRALLAGSMQQLLGSFMAPTATLLMGVRADDPQGRPVFRGADGSEEPETIVLFTSGPEVAAMDPALQIRSAPAVAALRYALEIGARSVAINALGPTATLELGQIRELIEIAEARNAQQPPQG
ncbi:SseB family protein [Rothia halotolerans]|uniref:SseB family protein n=1 Tax=Rothia halotolerans TaxID=405770 RepID=UPI00101D175E|nr:SseB family protein [Rothia halotolerans]